MNEKQQTAVQWLAYQLGITTGSLYDQSLAMEREQMIKFGNDCVEHYHTDWDMTCSVAEQLFTDTYQTKP